MGADNYAARDSRASQPGWTIFCSAPRLLDTGLEGLTFPSVEGALLTLKAKGFDPHFAIDIGAYVGEWTTLFKSVFPGCTVLMVEPQEDRSTA